VAVSGHGTQFLAFDQQHQAVEVVAHVLRRHRVLGLRQQLTELLLRHDQLLELAFGQRHAREIVGRQGLQAETAFASAHLQTLLFEHQADFTFRQGAQDVLQLAGCDGHCAIFTFSGTAGVGGDLNFDVGGEQSQLIALFLQQHVRQDRQGVSFFDDARNRLQRRQKLVALGFY